MASREEDLLGPEAYRRERDAVLAECVISCGRANCDLQHPCRRCWNDILLDTAVSTRIVLRAVNAQQRRLARVERVQIALAAALVGAGALAPTILPLVLSLAWGG